MDLDQLPLFAIFKLHRVIPSQRGDLVKIHLLAMVRFMLQWLMGRQRYLLLIAPSF